MVAPSSAPILVMVALPVALMERVPGPKYSMMALVPPLGWGDVATRRDLELLEARLDRRIDGMATKQDLAEMQRTFVTWLLISQATVVAAVGVLLAFLR